MLVKTAIIPAAGAGNRLGPFTQAIPKELLPIGNKAVIEHAIETSMIIGVNHIIVVCAKHKHGISDYLGSGKRFGIDISYVIQEERKGLADAILAASHLINCPFIVILGDNFIYPNEPIIDLISFHNINSADITVGAIQVEDTTRYGIIERDNYKILNIIEKPSQESAKSNVGAIGIYAFRNGDIFEAIKKTQMGVNGEYQLSDSINIMIEEGKNVITKILNCRHFDIGTPLDLMRANKLILNGVY